ncbi:chymotrypsinogen B-like [Triplophysa rosa]|uniref:chymotrypsinogen B-like n=1 Tax=Triplophysa rosa TaxID=992332 RepID=UPI002545C20F|nr:chymotrypsinogen B-like [Triplophysa rosa]
MWKTCVTLALLTCVQVCAHGPMHPRVAGGDDAKKKAWPWMVSLHDPTCHFCGGSLISSEWVLSAAHCFIGAGYKVSEKSIRVYLGKMTQREENKNEVFKEVQKIYTHDLYNAKTADNDIALLHLSSPVDLKTFWGNENKHICLVSLLAQGRDFPPDTRSMIIGWGKIKHRGKKNSCQ